MFDVARSHGLKLKEWIVENDVDQLSQTQVAQPTILIDGVARDRALRAAGLAPVLVAGHSLGEYSALVSAGALAPTDALDLVVERGRLMSTAVGGMAAIVKLELNAVRALCLDAGPDVVVANHNGHHQVVVSGAGASVDRVIEAAERAGGRGIRLRVSGPFHSPFMEPARIALAGIIDEAPFRAPSVPVVCGVSGHVETDAGRLRELMRSQMTACVRWVDVIDRLLEAGVSHAVEVGSGNVLTGLGKRITDRITFVTYEEVADGGV